MPSRLSGRTVDRNGETGYVLTLQTREQHIRRERATSNICTNEALYALASTIYLSALGKSGLRQVAELCYQKSQYAASQIGSLPGYSVPGYSGNGAPPFFREFVAQCPEPPAEINRRLMEQNILGGLDVSDRYPQRDAALRYRDEHQGRDRPFGVGVGVHLVSHQKTETRCLLWLGFPLSREWRYQAGCPGNITTGE